MSSTTAAEQEPGVLSHRQILTIFAGLMMGMFLASLDQTIVTSAIRAVADDLHGLDKQAWVTTAYLITSTISTPLYGKLSDLYGRKPFFLAAITIFVAGSAACGTATSMYELAAYRAFQGLGAGGLMSLALAIIADIVPPRERARYQGYFMGVFATSSVVGPVVGGFFAGRDHIFGTDGWRWIFYVNVPVGIVALAVVARVLNIPFTRRDHRIDWFGAVALVLCLVPLLIVAEQGRDWGWLSGRAVVSYVIGVLGLVLFIWQERRIGDEALLPIRFFRHPVFSLGSVISVVIGMGMFGGMASLPLYLQIVKGASPTEAGLMLLPLMAGLMAGLLTSGRLIQKTGRYKIFPVIGSAMMALGLLLFSFIGADTPTWLVSLLMVLFGAGLGQCMQPITLAVQNALPPRDTGVATSSVTFFRQMGGTLGTAVFLSILFSTVAGRIADAMASAARTADFQAALRDPAVLADPTNRQVIEGLQSGHAAGSPLSDSSFIQQLDPRLARPFLVGFSDAMDLVFLVGAAVMAVGFVLVLFLREEPLALQSSLQQRLAAEAAERAAAAPVATGEAEVAQIEAAGTGRHADGGVHPDPEPPVGRHAAENP